MFIKPNLSDWSSETPGPLIQIFFFKGPSLHFLKYFSVSLLGIIFLSFAGRDYPRRHPQASMVVSEQ